VLGLNAARLYGLSPDVNSYTEVPGDYRSRLTGDATLMKTMEYDDRLPNEVPAQNSQSPYGVATANRDDRLAKLRADYRDEAGTQFGVPVSNKRDGWIRVK
jgi:hypothetical protein